ncbi:NTF2-related export protein [Folsomia candida]|uniref:NTF2-related export protein n=1 Tax=Folsomia candida TaxID=158441 RepID=A0A226EPN5_FOLCA|nr:NTF2-related export protein [Folsomia candida]OXA59573.1 NTF2-related export protein [Folsomia candida]
MNNNVTTSAGTPNFTSAERRAAVDEAGKASDDFYRLFYKTLEMRPHRVAQLYLDSAVLIWDGNPYVTSDAIKKFYENLPSLTFSVATVDAQPLPREAVGDQKTFMITTGGSYRVSGVGNRNFSQTFVITAHTDKWKIASDVFRTQVHPTHANAL